MKKAILLTLLLFAGCGKALVKSDGLVQSEVEKFKDLDYVGSEFREKGIKYITKHMKEEHAWKQHKWVLVKSDYHTPNYGGYFYFICSKCYQKTKIIHAENLIKHGYLTQDQVSNLLRLELITEITADRARRGRE